MKKIFAIIVVLAMMAAMFVVSNAASVVNVDGAYLTNDENPKAVHQQDWIPTENDKDLKNEAIAGDLGRIYDVVQEKGYKYFHIQGWLGDSEDYTDIGYQFNDGEITWGQIIPEDGLAGAAGVAYCARYNLTVPVQTGTVDFNLYKKTAGGDAVKVKTIKYVNEDVVVFESKAVSGNDGNPGNAVWLNEDGESCAVKFTTTGAIGGVSMFFWASNGTNGSLGQFKAELFAFDTNVETSLAKAPVASTTVSWQGDNQPPFSWTFDNALDAGTYILRFTIFGETATGIDKETAYVVFPTVNTEISDEKFDFIGESAKAFNFAILGPSNVALENFYAANPAEGTSQGGQQGGQQPGGNPGTADASMVIFVVAAAAIALIILKKKAF